MSKAHAKISGPLGEGGQVNVMESGLTHCADSLAGGRDGEVKIFMGSPGDPLDKSPGVKSGYAGSVPDISKKFMRERQS